MQFIWEQKEVPKIAQLEYLELIMTGHVRLNQEQDLVQNQLDKLVLV